MSGPSRMTLEEARERLQGIADDLAAIRSRLLEVQASLPESPAEKFRLLDEEEEMDGATELRAVIGCVVEDSIRPAINDLRDVASLVRSSASCDSHEEVS